MTARRLRLDRPLVSFDLETTGLDVDKDRIVEVSCIKLEPDGTRTARTRRLHPGMPIPPGASAVHGITDADVADCPRFAQVARSLHGFLHGCDLTGFNVEKFDVPMLQAEFGRCGLEFPEAGTRVIDTYRIFAQREPRDLTAALRFYCGKELVGAHSAEADAQAAADILVGQLQRYEDLPDDVAGLQAVAHPVEPDWADPDGKLVWRQDQIVVTFGKHRDRTLRDLAATEPDYLRWIAEKNFSVEVRRLVLEVLQGQHPVRPSEPVR